MKDACLIAACDDLQLEVPASSSTTNLAQDGSFENASKTYFNHIVLTREPVTTYSYDKDGNLVSAKDGKNAQIKLMYYDNTSLSSAAVST